MSITLTTPVKLLSGVGPSKAAALKRLGIETVDDLLHHYPTSYYFAPRYGEPLVTGTPGTVVGIVTSVSGSSWGTPKFTAVVDTSDRDGYTHVTWFNGGYLRNQIFKGSRLMVSGIVDRDGGFTNPAYRVLKPSETPDPSVLNSVTYPVTKGITSREMSRLMLAIPRSLWWGRSPLPEALWFIHFPENQQCVDTARRQLKYDELFYMQLALAVQQAKRATVGPNVVCASTPADTTKYFPFNLTSEQMSAIGDIDADLCSGRAMNRLLQGDVGCGKTAVAAYAAILVAMNGGQTAILCPTEILARQHYETFKKYFDRAGVSVSLMIGNPPSDCKQIWGSDIVVGTTALLNPDRHFTRGLGLVIIDEQHKFGVEQRAVLRRHGNPHVLVMTATPIPRTIAMTVFGDLDVSSIKELPPGRLPVETTWHYDCDEAVMDRLHVELEAGHQVYVVCPRIEALNDEMRAVEEVVEEYRRLSPDASVGVLHGQMSPESKRLMQNWWTYPSDLGRILVSTTVVEVGVDNPNATVMVIEGAERFGLAQLWQLRGRVGRGKDQAYCFLLSDTDSQDARARLRAMETATSGFEIAEQDLILRGPGDLLSTSQHGLPDLKIADLVADYDILLEAREDAQNLVRRNPDLSGHPEMRAELVKRFGDYLDLGDVG